MRRRAVFADTRVKQVQAARAHGLHRHAAALRGVHAGGAGADCAGRALPRHRRQRRDPGHRARRGAARSTDVRRRRLLADDADPHRSDEQRLALSVPVAALHEVVRRAQRAAARRSSISMTTDAGRPRAGGAAAAGCCAARAAAARSIRSAAPSSTPRIRSGRRTARRSTRRRARRAGCSQSPPADRPALAAARRHDQRRQLPQPHAGARHRRGAQRSTTSAQALAFARDERAQGVDRRRAAQHGRPRLRAGRARARHARVQPHVARRARQDRHGAERRDLARHPERAASAVRRQGDAVHRHLHRRRLDLGQRARHGPPGRLGRPDRPLDAGDAAGRHRPARSAATEDPRAVPAWSSAATACSASSSTPSSRSPTTPSTSPSGGSSTTGRSPTSSRASLPPIRRYGLLYGHLSTAPQIAAARRCCSTPTGRSTAPARRSRRSARSARSSCGGWSSTSSKLGPLAMRLKWFAEKHLEPRLESCTVSRNQAMGEGEACLVSRNEPMHDSVPYLQNALPDETDILHEYFIPRDAVRAVRRRPAPHRRASSAPTC